MQNNKDIETLSINDLSIIRKETEFLMKHYKNLIEINAGFSNEEKQASLMGKFQKYAKINEFVINKIEKKITEMFNEKDLA